MSRFDRFASKAADFVASTWFFAACVLLVVLWAPSFLIIKNLDTWQLIINTTTTIVTFLMLALLHNDQQRFEKAVNARFEEVIEAIEGATDPVDDPAQKEKNG